MTEPAASGLDVAETRRTLAIIALAGFASSFAARFFDPMVAVVARDLGADTGRIALLATAFALPYAFIQPILGPIGDALGKIRVMTVCVACLAVGLAGCALAPNDTVLFAARVLSGAAGGGIIPLALATIGDRIEMANRQVAIGRFLVFTLSGQLVGGTVSGILSEFLGWRLVVGAACLVATASFGLLVFGIRGTAPPAGGFRIGQAAERFGRILSIGRARALFGFVFVEGLIVFGLMPYLAPLLEADGRGGAFEAGLILAAFALGGVCYTFAVGWLLRTLGVARMLVAAGLLVGGIFAALAAETSWVAEAGLFLGIGFGFYTLHNSYQTQVTEVVSDARASAVSLHAFSFYCGQALGPVVIGTGLERLGYVRTMEFCGLGALALGVASSFILFPRQPLGR